MRNNENPAAKEESNEIRQRYASNRSKKQPKYFHRHQIEAGPPLKDRVKKDPPINYQPVAKSAQRL
jgi:hypothetical protein